MNLNRSRLSSVLGCIFEWYDFSLYGFFAPVLASLYFPSHSEATRLIIIMGVFAIGFLARPIGALVFGYISDKYGRVTCLKITPILITIPSLFVAVLPTYQNIGALAPLLLIISRIVQGLSIGGEFTNNIVYMCESANAKNKYLLGSIGAFTGSIGIFLASIVAVSLSSKCSHRDLVGYGWRLGFLISGLFGGLTYLMRRSMVESSVYEKLLTESAVLNNPLTYSIRQQPLDYIKAILLICFPATFFYFIFMFLPNYLQSIVGQKSSIVLGDNTFSLFVRLLLIPIFGYLADRFTGLGMLRISCIMFLMLGLFLFHLMANNTNLLVYGLVLFGCMSTINSAVIPGLVIGFLNPNTRSTIFSFAFNFSFGFFGGIVPLLSLLLVKWTGNQDAPIYYLLGTAIITFITTFYLSKVSYYD